MGTATHKCPTCGAPLSGYRPYVDLDRNQFISISGVVSLSAMEAEIAAVLARAYPGVARRDAIILGVWGGGDVPISNSATVIISKLRKRLNSIGWTVKSVRSRGYMLTRIEGGPHEA